MEIFWTFTGIIIGTVIVGLFFDDFAEWLVKKYKESMHEED